MLVLSVIALTLCGFQFCLLLCCVMVQPNTPQNHIQLRCEVCILLQRELESLNAKGKCRGLSSNFSNIRPAFHDKRVCCFSFQSLWTPSDSNCGIVVPHDPVVFTSENCLFNSPSGGNRVKVIYQFLFPLLTSLKWISFYEQGSPA